MDMRGAFFPCCQKVKRGTILKTLYSPLIEQKNDPKIKAVLLMIEGSSLGFAQIQEIREALKKFKESGKPVYAFADSFGDLSNGTGSYYLASVATEIWLQPLGNLNLTGIFIETPFARKALDNLKINPRIDRREDYKGFMESVTESDFTPAVRANMQRIVNGLTEQMIADISQSRQFDVETARRLINNGPYVSAEALQEKLIDQIDYLDVLKNKLIEDFLKEKEKSSDHSFVSLGQYVSHKQTEVDHKAKIALVFGEGPILNSTKGNGLMDNDYMIVGRKMAKAIHDATEDKDVKAIVLRLNSGGGSPTASETIWRQVKIAQEKGKPVVISMSDYAASGAYWIASKAKKIVAQPGTLTGSIGVLAGKIVTSAAWENYGIHWGEVHNGDNSAMWSTSQDYSKKGWERLQVMLDNIYGTFLIKVSEGRHMDKEKVRSLAQGQVWTGLEAKENGLVDALGGLSEAIDLAKQEIGLTPETQVNLQEFPKPLSFSERLFGLAADDENDGGFFSKLSSLYTAFNRVALLFADISTTEPLKAQRMAVK